jgi:hypothetical protein
MVDDFLRDLAGNPDLYPQKLDLRRDAVLIMPFTERGYREASFLDDRILSPEANWVSVPALRAVMTNADSIRPLHFLFHAGHAGSTLISRLLDETHRVLGLREPLPLRTLAQMHDAMGQPPLPVTREQFEDQLETFLQLWSRGYSWTQAVVIKATSSAGRLASPLLAMRPDSRGVYLNLAHDVFLATMLSRSAAIADMQGFAPERILRLSRLIGDFGRSLQAMSVGELAAASWLTERLTEEEAARALGERLLHIDFDSFLHDPFKGLAAILAHFGLAIPRDEVERIATGPVMRRYSKAPDEFAYTAELREQILAQSREANRAEITRGRMFLEILAAQNPQVASVL